jgi:hypothetical protein
VRRARVAPDWRSMSVPPTAYSLNASLPSAANHPDRARRAVLASEPKADDSSDE